MNEDGTKDADVVDPAETSDPTNKPDNATDRNDEGSSSSGTDPESIARDIEEQLESNAASMKPSEFPTILPVLPVRNMVVFPGTVVPLSVGREKSRRLIDSVLEGDKLVAVFAQREEGVDDPGIDDVYRVGTAARVLKLLHTPDGSANLLVHGVWRVGLEEFTSTDPFWQARVNPQHDEKPPETVELSALAHNARETAERIIDLSPNVPDEAKLMLQNIDEPGPLADFLAANLSLGIVEKQELLETFDVGDRLRKISLTLQNQIDVLELSSKIQTEVREQIDQSQRRYFLSEQLKAIRKELGETDTEDADLQTLQQRVKDAKLPESAQVEADRELQRLQRIPQASPEYGVARDYLDWLVSMPWHEQTTDNLDLDQAESILNEDHFGLEKIKRRIIEHLAVTKLNPEGGSPILCLVGPPGVGKTSLGRSIARALGRKFIRIALGGVRDEADIRGHRRTYIGSVPGRIIQEIRKCGSRNPVMMLDEMDKLGSDFRGDPASALLEVLDPEQNQHFTDHYLGVPFDLSRVMFIATANYLDPVHVALRDRMEIIALSSYTLAEKREIAKRYLVPRQLERHGITDQRVTFPAATLVSLIEDYTRESGVRNLTRTIGAVCRGLAAKVARDEVADVKVDPGDLVEYLGPARFQREQNRRVTQPGIITGLAYTPVGGDLIFVEATWMPGRGGFQITGQIGDVMRESAQAALSLIRSRAKTWGLIGVARIPERDVHIHVPAGGIPKDGPSAGVAILSALVSLFSEQIAEPRVAMTGEITLRGHVLPIGGVKEKVLAAHRAGIETVILPAQNEADLADVPEEVREALKVVFASRIEDVLSVILPGVLPKRHTRAIKTASDSGGGNPASTKRTGTKRTSAQRTAKRSSSAKPTKKKAKSAPKIKAPPKTKAASKTKSAQAPKRKSTKKRTSTSTSKKSVTKTSRAATGGRRR